MSRPSDTAQSRQRKQARQELRQGAHFWPSTGVRSITSTHASGALQIGRFQQSWPPRAQVKPRLPAPRLRVTGLGR